MIAERSKYHNAHQINERERLRRLRMDPRRAKRLHEKACTYAYQLQREGCDAESAWLKAARTYGLCEVPECAE